MAPSLIRAYKKFVAEQRQSAASTFTLSDAEIAQFKAKGYTDEQIKLLAQMQTDLTDTRQQQQTFLSPASISQSLTQQTGVPERVWL
ncbi:MAG: hypothetical protein WA077_15125, partial [Anaerolineae bacterium]